MPSQELRRDQFGASWRRFASFNLVGGLGALVQVGALAVLLTLGIHYLTATALAVQTAVVHNFCWHERRTWRDRGGGGRSGMIRRLLRFNLTIGMVSIAQNLLLMKILAGALGIDYLAANVASIGACSFVNFLLCERLVFTDRQPFSSERLKQAGHKPALSGRKEDSMLQFQIQPRSLLTIVLACAIALSPASLRAQELPAETVAGWNLYVQLTESRIERELGSRDHFFAFEFQAPPKARSERASILSGEVTVAKMQTRKKDGRAVPVPRGKIHHWRGAVFIPNISLQSVLEAARQIDGQAHRQEDVQESKVLEQGDDSARIYLRLTRRHIVRATYNTEHLVRFRRIDPERAESRSMATRIAELANAGTRMESEKPPDGDRGFLWRLNSYWRYRQVAEGVLVECESLSLSRSIPAIAAPVINPIVDSIARESMTRTLASMKRRFQEGG